MGGVSIGGREACVACRPNFKHLACLVAEISAEKSFPIVTVSQGPTIGSRCKPAVYEFIHPPQLYKLHTFSQTVQTSYILSKCTIWINSDELYNLNKFWQIVQSEYILTNCTIYRYFLFWPELFSPFIAFRTISCVKIQEIKRGVKVLTALGKGQTN